MTNPKQLLEDRMELGQRILRDPDTVHQVFNRNFNPLRAANSSVAWPPWFIRRAEYEVGIRNGYFDTHQNWEGSDPAAINANKVMHDLQASDLLKKRAKKAWDGIETRTLPQPEYEFWRDYR